MKLEKLVVIRAYLGAKPVVLGQVAPVMVNSYYVNHWNLPSLIRLLKSTGSPGLVIPTLIREEVSMATTLRVW